jgi:hypothetical protein
MFSIFGSKSHEDAKSRARDAFEKIASVKTDSREARSARLRMGLLCRGHIDKTFIDGAEKTAAWQELAKGAIVRGTPAPAAPAPSTYQTLSTASGEVTVYLPEEIVQEVFHLGARYQKAELSGQDAINAVQVIADQLFRYELHMGDSFDVLQFLRAEVNPGDSQPAEMEKAASAS